jgi:hypothetical protein
MTSSIEDGRAPRRAYPLRRNAERRHRTLRSVVALSVIAVVGTLVSVPSVASAATVTGSLVTSGLSAPGGGVWLSGGGGHFWVSDNALGLCETVPATSGTTKCNGTGKGGQVAFDATNSMVYQADTSSKTNRILRYPYTSANDSLNGATTLQVPNLTAVGGGAGGGRARGVAIVTGTDGVQRMYVAYLKSGDIMQVLNPSGKDKTGATVTPAVSKVASTSDSRGAYALSVFTWTDSAAVRHDDLYVAESGGLGLSVVRDVDGTGGHPACSASTTCTATTLVNASGAALINSPTGLDNDGLQMLVADGPLNTPSRLLSYNPVSGAKAVVSTDITPTYTSTFDGATRTQYQNITGIALAPSGDIYVGDDPSFPLATPVTAQGHLWKVSATALQPTITSIAPATGDVAGGTAVTIKGTNLVNAVAGATDPVAFGTTIRFGTTAATAVSCNADGLTCTASSPAASGAGGIDIRVKNIEGQTSPAVAGDQFTYTTAAAAPGAPAVTKIAPATGLASGGTTVTVTGTNLVNADGTAQVSFGPDAATGVTCLADGTSCSATSPGGTAGTTVDVQVTTIAGTSPAVAADKFTFASPVGALYSYGITAPKGGVTWIPDATPLGGHEWISDHGNGLCRLDPVPGTKIFAPNVAECDPGFTLGSPGQAVYDSRANSDGTHWLYVPDNAVRSPGVWRLTFHPATATIDTPVRMANGQISNLKANGLALDQARDALYVGDLVDGNIRRINNVSGDPLSQTVDIVATTQAAKAGAASRGINGTMAMLGNLVFLPENNAATYFDVTAACANPTVSPNPAPCATTTLNFLKSAATVFVAGMAADSVHKVVYISESPGTANATIFRMDATTITAANPGGAAGVVYVTDGLMPAASSAEATVYCSLTCTRPADPALTQGGTAGFPFAQGLYVDPVTNALFITEDVSAGARSGRGHVWSVPYIP